MRTLLGVCLVASLMAAPARGQGTACTAPEMRITSEAISGSVEREFEEAFRKAHARVCAWWGSGYAGRFTVAIEESRGPSMALVPAWRGQRGTMLFRARATERGRAAITHELVHVFAPNANRFLAEGLAVYAHEHLGGVAAYPNDGDDLNETARDFADKADFNLLDRVATPARLETSHLDGREAYIVAGSFVRFLIESYGLDRFRRLYALTPLIPRARNAGDPGRWTEIYGKDIVALGKDWKAKIGG